MPVNYGLPSLRSSASYTADPRKRCGAGEVRSHCRATCPQHPSAILGRIRQRRSPLVHHADNESGGQPGVPHVGQQGTPDPVAGPSTVTPTNKLVSSMNGVEMANLTNSPGTESFAGKGRQSESSTLLSPIGPCWRQACGLNFSSACFWLESLCSVGDAFNQLCALMQE